MWLVLCFNCKNNGILLRWDCWRGGEEESREGWGGYDFNIWNLIL